MFLNFILKNKNRKKFHTQNSNEAFIFIQFLLNKNSESINLIKPNGFVCEKKNACFFFVTLQIILTMEFFTTGIKNSEFQNKILKDFQKFLKSLENDIELKVFDCTLEYVGLMTECSKYCRSLLMEEKNDFEEMLQSIINLVERDLSNSINLNNTRKFKQQNENKTESCTDVSYKKIDNLPSKNIKVEHGNIPECENKDNNNASLFNDKCNDKNKSEEKEMKNNNQIITKHNESSLIENTNKEANINSLKDTNSIEEANYHNKKNLIINSKIDKVDNQKEENKEFNIRPKTENKLESDKKNTCDNNTITVSNNKLYETGMEEAIINDNDENKKDSIGIKLNESIPKYQSTADRLSSPIDLVMNENNISFLAFLNDAFYICYMPFYQNLLSISQIINLNFENFGDLSLAEKATYIGFKVDRGIYSDDAEYNVIKRIFPSIEIEIKKNTFQLAAVVIAFKKFFGIGAVHYTVYRIINQELYLFDNSKIEKIKDYNNAFYEMGKLGVFYLYKKKIIKTI